VEQVGMMPDAQAIREALRCPDPRCGCYRHWRNTHCPAHHDETPSLTVTERNGRVLVHCHAGCSQEVLIAILRERHLWPSSSPRQRLIRYRRRRSHW
jgi:hypothetical protein